MCEVLQRRNHGSINPTEDRKFSVNQEEQAPGVDKFEVEGGARRRKRRSSNAAPEGEGWVMRGSWREGQNLSSNDLSASPRSLWFILQGEEICILSSGTQCELKEKEKKKKNKKHLAT